MVATLRGKLASSLRRLARHDGFARREDGTAAVEFAIVAAPFIALVLATLQAMAIFFSTQVLETVTAESARLIMTGQSSAASQTSFATAVCSKVPALFTCNKIMIDVQTYTSFQSANTATPTLTYDGSGNVTNTWQYSPGNPGDIVVVRIMYQWPIVLGPLGLNFSNQGNSYRLLMATAAFKNEP